MRILAPSAAGHAGDAGPSLQNAVNTANNCCAERWAVVLSVLLLLWLARVLRGPCFFRVGFRVARARATPATKLYYLQCFVAFAFSGWLAGCSFWAAVSAASGALARDPMSAFWAAARLGPRKLASPASSGVGVGNMHNLTSHIIAQDTFLIQKHDMTWYNFKEA